MKGRIPRFRTLQTLAARVQRRVERTLLPLGNVVECPFCKWTGWRFLSAGLHRRPNRLCPQCGSLERYRMLPLLLKREIAGRGGPLHVLELAPKACFTSYCRKQGWRYVSSDLSSPSAMVRGDLTRMPFATGSFDLIVCFHVLEHIHDDLASLREIARLLSASGVAIICVPLQAGKTQEGAPEADWERLYGQSDHVRFYGMDIKQRMQAAGLDVRCIDALNYFSTAEIRRHALRGDDRYIFAVTRTSPA